MKNTRTETSHLRLGFTLMRERSPISTRIELGCLGLAGIFWLCKNSSCTIFSDLYLILLQALGAFLATSDSESADVECFASADSTNDAIDMPGCQ